MLLSLITFSFLFALLIVMFLPINNPCVNLVIDSPMAVGYFLLSIASKNTAIPFYAAGLGTCVYLLRQTQTHLKDRTFNPARIPGHFIRLILGVIAGGTIVLFPDLMGSNPKIGHIGIGQGSLAFLLGYGVEVFYDALDGLKKKLSPSKD